VKLGLCASLLAPSNTALLRRMPLPFGGVLKRLLPAICGIFAFGLLSSLMDFKGPTLRPSLARHSHQNNFMKRVLFFTPFFEDTDWKSFGLNPEKLGKVGCEFTNCEGTSNRSLFPIETYHAIVFHGRNMDSNSKVCCFLAVHNSSIGDLVTDSVTGLY